MIRRLLLALFCVACVMLGADLSGRWSGNLKMSIDGNQVEVPHEIVLKHQGGVISGTAGPGPEEQWPISKATLSGAELIFEVKAPDGPMFEYKLTVSGSEMSGEYKTTLEGQVSTATLALKKR